MELQKLCYYSQAWSLAWDEEPYFKSTSRLGRMGQSCLPYTRNTGVL